MRRAAIAGSEQVQSAQVITIATPIILKETLTKFVFCRKLKVNAAMDDMIKRIHAKNIPVGTIALTPEQAKHFAELGASFLGLGADTAFLVQAADNTLDTFKKAIEG